MCEKVGRYRVRLFSANQCHGFWLNTDMDMALDNIVPETLKWRHTDEGAE